MGFIKLLFSFEFIFILWLFSYQYKNALEVFTSPDITVLLTLVLIPWGTFLYCKNKTKSLLRDPALLVFLCMSLWFIASSFWSPSHAYKLQKTLCYTIYTIPGFLMGYSIISNNPERLKRLMKAFLIFSILVLIESYHAFFINGLKMTSDIMNTNYLVTGQTLGAGLLVLIAYSYFELILQKNKDKTSILKQIPSIWFGFLLLGSLFFYVLLNLGGRGPLIATSGALSIFYGVKYWQDPPPKPGIHCGIMVLLCTLTYFVLNGFFDHPVSHFERRVAPLLTGQIDEAIYERFAYYLSAFLIFLEHPLVGVGFGGWPISHGLGDVSLHPHNIFLEILSETGLIGIILFMTLLYFIFRRLKLCSIFSTPEHTSLILLTIFSFINAQKTGDLHDNLLLFLTLSLCAGIRNWKNDYATT